MTDPASAALSPWLTLAAAILLAYRAGIACLLAAFHALPSLQRRRLLEEEAIPDPLLADLLEKPYALRMEITLLSQGLLVMLLVLLWPLARPLPGGAWVFGLLALLYIWLMDLLLPTWLTAAEPGLWLQRLFPLFAPLHRAARLFVAPAAGHFRRQREAQEKAREQEDEPATDDAVTALLEEGEAEGILEEEDRELIRNVVGFGDTVVREVMTPRTGIHAIPSDASLEEAWEAFRQSRHTRMPIFEGTVDRVVGVLMLKDLMQHPDEPAPDLRHLAKPPHFVPESKPTLDLLRELQRARLQLAVVVDEFGGVSGLVTVEDLLEEVFGEIRDEHEATPEIQEQGPGVLLVSGQVHVDDLAQRLDLEWERDGFDTVAGLVMARLGHVPHPQESVAVEGARLTVLRMEGPRILQVKVERPAAPPQPC